MASVETHRHTTSQACTCKPPEIPRGYETARIICGLVIAICAFKSRPKIFATCAGLGFTAQYFIPQLSKDMSQETESCASGCSDIVAQSHRLKFDPRVSLLIATIFFSCHIEHHGREMVPVVGAVFGCRIFHILTKWF